MVTTGIIAWGITNKLSFAITIGLFDTSIKLFIYYIHERLWLRIPFGRCKQLDFEI